MHSFQFYCTCIDSSQLHGICLCVNTYIIYARLAKQGYTELLLNDIPDNRLAIENKSEFDIIIKELGSNNQTTFKHKVHWERQISY